MHKYRLVIADPPWSYNDQGTRLSPAYEGKQRKSGKRYDGMTLQEICDLGDWVRWVTEPDSILLLWATPPLRETHPWPVLKAWNYEYKTSIPWLKGRWDEKQRRFVYHISGGHYARACSEDLFICTRGKAASMIVDKGVPGAIIAPSRGKGIVHSQKPDQQYEIAERLLGGKGPFFEMFARSNRYKWDYWGDHWWWGSDLVNGKG